MEYMEVLNKLYRYGPCSEGREWFTKKLQSYTVAQVWKMCRRADWMLWYLKCIAFDGALVPQLEADFNAVFKDTLHPEYPHRYYTNEYPIGNTRYGHYADYNNAVRYMFYTVCDVESHTLPHIKSRTLRKLASIVRRHVLLDNHGNLQIRKGKEWVSYTAELEAKNDQAMTG